MKRVILTFAVAVAIGAATSASAGVLYSTAGSVYSQNFDGLPHGTHNGKTIQFNGSAHVQNGQAPFPGGWKDDTDFDNTNIGIKGWYLWHSTALTAATGGVSTHAQFRYGTGGGGSGFFAFSSGQNSPNIEDKALGVISANGIIGSAGSRGRAYIGLQLINDTGKTLDSFTVIYDGEQYRDHGITGYRDGFDFQWSLTKTAANWSDSTGYSGIANSFLSPIDGTTAAALNGNQVANRVPNITHTITGITWAPGAELWIRWRDGNRDFANGIDLDDGIAIDNVRFSATAVPEPGTFVLAGLGLAAVGLMRRKR